MPKCTNVFERASEVDPQQARIAELERLAGKQSLELEILKKALTLLPGSTAVKRGHAAHC